MCVSDIFQEKMFTSMEELEYARTYLDGLLVLSSFFFEEQLQDIEQVLLCLKNVDIKVHVKNSNFGRTEIDYLGYVVTREGIKSHPKKIEAVLKLKNLNA